MHSIVKNDDRGKEDGFKVHCFPEISGSSGRKYRSSMENECTFQRFDFSADGRAGGGVPSVSGSGGDADENVKEIEAAAYEKGFSRGQRDGIENGKRELNPVLNNFRQALAELETIKKEIFLRAEKGAVDLALAIARKVICHEVKTNKATLLQVVREALKQVGNQENIKIKISPGDLSLINNPKMQFPSLADHSQNVTIEGDSSITSGGCIIETDIGEIDARIEKQLQALEEAFQSEFGKTGVGE